MAKAASAPPEGLIDETKPWRPDDPSAEGNHDNPIEGVLVGVDMFTGGEYDDYPILFLELDSGDTVAVHCFRTLLRNKVIELKPKYGERLKIAWGGEQQSKGGGRPYHLYRVMVVGREGGSFDWGRLDPSAADDSGRVVYEDPGAEQAQAAAKAEDNIPF